MVHGQPPIALGLILSTLWICGCDDSHARSAPSLSSSTSAPSPTPVAAKHPPRDSAFSVYNNPTYGVSFRYPRNFELHDEPEPNVNKTQRELNVEQPGSIPVAMVLIPGDAYPNTTFRSGSLQLVINPVVTPEICQSFAAPPESDWYGITGTATVQGITFHWRERGSAAAGTGYENRNYAGFSNGTCYEFFLEVVISDSFDPDSSIKPVDTTKILHHLEKIIFSLQIHPPALVASPKPPPVVHSFAVESLPHPLLQGVVRISWEISGARENEVYLGVNCAGFADLNPLPDPPSSVVPSTQTPLPDPSSTDRFSRPGLYKLESNFSCGCFTPIPPSSGSFRLQIENHSAQPVTFTLFVFGLNYITRTVH